MRCPRSESGVIKTSRVVAVLRVMIGEASTSDIQRTRPVREGPNRDTGERRVTRGRILLIIGLVFVLALVAGLGFLGLNPPNPVPKPVEKVLPNDKFQVR